MTIPTIIVDIGFTTTSSGNYWHIGDSERGKIETAAIGPDGLNFDGFWEDVTSYVKRVEIVRGASRIEGPALRHEAGRVTIVLDNSDRRFDPSYLSGPYVSAGVTQVTPMRPVRVRAIHNDITYDLYRGFADSWDINYDGGPFYSFVTLTATDATKVLSAYDRVAVGSVGSGEDTGARISRILTSVGWPTSDRIIAVGDSTVQATTLDGMAWTEALLVQDTELGELYVDPAGKVRFRNRVAAMEETRSNTSQATFDDVNGLPYQDTKPDYSDETIANLVRIARVGGSQQTATDASSVAQYLTRVYERTDLLMESDTVAADYAGYVLHQMKDPELRFATISITPRHYNNTTEDALFVQVLGRIFGDRITTIRNPPGGGTITQDSFIRGVRHAIVPGLDWQTIFTLQPASTLSYWTVEHATLGQIGTVNALAY